MFFSAISDKMSFIIYKTAYLRLFCIIVIFIVPMFLLPCVNTYPIHFERHAMLYFCII